MQDSSRQYSCLCCHSIIIICCRCDRGNRYCKHCAPIMSLKARQRAGKRYQSTYQGRINHAARQKRYRERLKQKVTHKGSKVISLCDLLIEKRKSFTTKIKIETKANSYNVFCHCCDKICSPFFRHDSLGNSKLGRKLRFPKPKKPTQ